MLEATRFKDGLQNQEFSNGNSMLHDNTKSEAFEMIRAANNIIEE